VDINSSEDVMNQRIALGLAMLAGVAIGATAIQGLHAQAKAPAYYVAEINPADPDGWAKTYAPLVQPTFQPFGGRYVARAGKTVAFDGDLPKRVVIIAFDSIEKAQAWRDSAAYKAIIPTRDKFLGNGTARSYAIEGQSN
jgi:uncharacterized protein (DUF1330 family)